MKDYDEIIVGQTGKAKSKISSYCSGINNEKHALVWELCIPDKLIIKLNNFNHLPKRNLLELRIKKVSGDLFFVLNTYFCTSFCGYGKNKKFLHNCTYRPW